MVCVVWFRIAMHGSLAFLVLYICHFWNFCQWLSLTFSMTILKISLNLGSHYSQSERHVEMVTLHKQSAKGHEPLAYVPHYIFPRSENCQKTSFWQGLNANPSDGIWGIWAYIKANCELRCAQGKSDSSSSYHVSWTGTYIQCVYSTL